MTELNEITIPTTENWITEREAWIDKREEIVATALTITAVTDDESANTAGELYTKATKALKELASERLAITRQIDALKKQFTDQEKELSAPLVEVQNRIKPLVDKYNTEKELARQAELRRIADEEAARQEAEARAQMEAEELFGAEATIQPEAMPPPPPVVTPEKVALSGAKVVKRWSYDVRDISKVSPEFLSVSINDKAVRAYLSMCTATGREPSVPGLNFSFTMSTQSK